MTEKVFFFFDLFATRVPPIVPSLVRLSCLCCMSSSEASGSDFEVQASARTLPQRGSKRNAGFEPPQGAVLISGPDGGAGAIERGEFDWDSVKNDKDVELWLVRVPNSVCSVFGLPPLFPFLV